jgi:hypothetical protein
MLKFNSLLSNECVLGMTREYKLILFTTYMDSNYDISK